MKWLALAFLSAIAAAEAANYGLPLVVVFFLGIVTGSALMRAEMVRERAK